MTVLMLRSRLRRGDDGVALLMALAMIAIISTIMLSMLAVVIGQVKPVALSRKSTGSVNAAASGLQAGLTSLRSATDANGEGNRGRLVCSAATAATFQQGATSVSAPGAGLQGQASGLPGDFNYRVAISYFLTDPTDRPAAWLRDNAMPCPLTQTPLFAYLQSYGTGSAVVPSTAGRGNRSQTGVYQFLVPSENIAGGRLRSFGRDRCIDAGSAAPAVGTRLYLRTCLALGTPQQTFEYRGDLTLFYGGNPSLNLCIQSNSSQQPQLQRCTGTGTGSTYPYAPLQQVQLWSFNDNGHFAAAADDGNVTNDCLQPQTDTVGAQLVLVACSGGTTEWQAFDPDPEVGAGKSGGNVSGVVGPPTKQYVNFAEFGRCLDITGQNVNADHLIAYPCKQAPDSSRLTFNQVWTASAGASVPATMRVTLSGVDYCLTAPASGNLITTKLCVTPAAANQRWTATGLVPGSPTTSYNLISASRNECMSVSREGAITFGSSNIVLEPCSGSLKQRWNAPPPLPPAGLGNIREGTSVAAGP